MTLRIQGLAIRHDGAPLLHDISLCIDPGQTLCLMGASGGGKSLIAQAIAGLLPACMDAAGHIALGAATRPAADQPALRALWGQTCILPQEPGRALVPALRAIDQAALAPPRLGRPAAAAWLARFGLDDAAAARRPAALSGGMAQRLLVALLARTAAPVLVLDEPTTGLDAESRAALLDSLATLRDAGRALLVITHDLAVVRALGGTLSVLEHGRIAENGPAETLLHAPASAFLRACLAADPASWPRRVLSRPATDVLEARSLVIGHGRHTLAGPLHLDLGAGHMAAILGHSGAGKTTLGDTILGLVPPRAGRLAWFGRSLDAAHLRTHRPRFQKLHQDPTAVFPAERTLAQSLQDLRHLPDGRAATARIPALLDRLRLDPAILARRPGAISGGEAQRAAMVRALALRPALLVADEPASRLDPPVQAEALQLLRHLADTEGLAVMLITHDHHTAKALADSTLTLP